MLSGTSERKIWPLAVKFDPSREIKDGLMPPTIPESPVLSLLFPGGDMVEHKRKKTRRWVLPSFKREQRENWRKKLGLLECL
jgi:hypothetical protein